MRKLSEIVKRKLWRKGDKSWFWPLLLKYRNQRGETLEESEIAWRAKELHESRDEAKVKWKWSPKSEMSCLHLLALIGSRFGIDEEFTYLEFGACFGTTLCSVFKHFRKAKGIGLEINPSRFDVCTYVVEKQKREFGLEGRIVLQPVSILEAALQRESVDVVFMDTNHTYDDYDYIMHLLGNSVLRRGFLFIGDDPLHTGTNLARKQFIEKHSDSYKVITRPDWNLWWFFEK